MKNTLFFFIFALFCGPLCAVDSEDEWSSGREDYRSSSEDYGINEDEIQTLLGSEDEDAVNLSSELSSMELGNRNRSSSRPSRLPSALPASIITQEQGWLDRELAIDSGDASDDEFLHQEGDFDDPVLAAAMNAVLAEEEERAAQSAHVGLRTPIGGAPVDSPVTEGFGQRRNHIRLEGEDEYGSDSELVGTILSATDVGPDGTWRMSPEMTRRRVAHTRGYRTRRARNNRELTHERLAQMAAQEREREQREFEAQQQLNALQQNASSSPNPKRQRLNNDSGYSVPANIKRKLPR